MKRLILLAFVAVAAARVTQKEKTPKYVTAMSEVFNLTVEDVQNCFNSTGTTEEDMLYVSEIGENSELDHLSRISCLLACCAKKQGTMVGMKMNVPKLIETIINFKHNIGFTAFQLKQIENILNECNQSVTETKNECKAVVEFATCLNQFGI